MATASQTAPSKGVSQQFPIDTRGASVDPKDYTWGTPSYPVLCQQFFQLQLLFTAQQQQLGALPQQQGAPNAQPFAFPSPCAFAAVPFASGFLPAGGMMGMPQQPNAHATAQPPAQAAALPVPGQPASKTKANAKANKANVGSAPSSNKAAKTSKQQTASCDKQQSQLQQTFDYELDADEFRKLLEVLPDLEDGSLSDNCTSMPTSAELSNEHLMSASPRDSGCNNNMTDPFRSNASMEFDAFDLDLEALLPGEPSNTAPVPSGVPSLPGARAPPMKAASCDLNNLQQAAKLSAAANKASKSPKASKVSGAVQKASGSSKANKGSAPHASKAAVQAAVAEEAALADFSKLLGDEDNNRFSSNWDMVDTMDLVDTIDFANPFSTPVTVN